ncbi:hypothetical protein [Tenggerimyces flavus]|uniref:Uncharacterized protein n=1 Tax=Tenggerimyces flavus TaxID=1708749 RepID=A0ABV7YPA1_9ACTN|nr:hypothetical protein [Tenggerimyces flavus]MBM7784485.1 hypothetical protein [Tenggerimyces flavus]
MPVEGEPLEEEVELPPDKAAAKVAESFWRNLSFGDGTATCDALTPEMQDKTPWLTGQTGDCPAQMRKLHKRLDEREVLALRTAIVERVTISESGTKATVDDNDVTMHDEDEVGTSSSSMELEFDDGRWLISSLG